MKHVPLYRCVSSLLVLLLVAIGCGGGGGGGSPLGLLSGTYSFIAFGGTNGAPDEGNTSWGEIAADGAGTFTGGTVTNNVNGAVSPPSGTGSIGYDVDGARTFSLLGGTGSTPDYTGKISADGSVAALASVSASTPPAILLMGRKAGTYSDASLSGLYHVCAFGYDPTVSSDLSYFGAMTFDGLGSAAGSLSLNVAALTSGPFAISLTYSTAPDGALTVAFSSDGYKGQICAGGDLILLAGGTSTTEAPVVMVLVKGTAGASNALLSGAYGLVGLQADTSPPPEWTSITIPATSDGLAMITLGAGGLVNEDSVITSAPVGGGPPYAVGPDGFLSVSSGTYEGGVAPSGNFAVFAGQTGSGTPEFWFMVR